MTAIAEHSTTCEICGKSMKVFTGLENWAVLENGVIKSLCHKCSFQVKLAIEALRGEISRDNVRAKRKLLKCPNCKRERMWGGVCMTCLYCDQHYNEPIVSGWYCQEKDCGTVIYQASQKNIDYHVLTHEWSVKRKIK